MTWQTGLTIFYVVWLCAVLVLLTMIYRSSQDRLHHVELMERSLMQEASDSVKAAQKAVDAVYILADKFGTEEQE